MLPVMVGLLHASSPSPIAVIAQDIKGLSPEDKSALVEALHDALEGATGQRAVTDPFATTIEEVRQRTGADVVLTASVISGAKLARITLERQSLHGEAHRLQLDVGRDRSAWLPAVDGAVRSLFPPLPGVEVRPDPPVLVPEPAGVGRTVAWVSVGGAVAIAGAAIALRVVAEQRADQAFEHAMQGDGSSAGDAASQSRTFGGVSNVSFGVAGALATGALVYLLTDG